MTVYSQLGYSAAAQHCRDAGNWSLPMIRGRDVERHFTKYLHDDPRALLKDRDVWLGAQSQPISAGLQWTWVNGTSTSMYIRHSHGYERSRRTFYDCQASMPAVIRQETRVAGPARHTPTPHVKPARPARPTRLQFQEFAELRACSGAMGIPNSGKPLIGFNGAPHIYPQNYPFP